MDKIQSGMLAVSKAGHDVGKLYIIVSVDGEYVYLADGKIRSLSNQKKKKQKHIQIIKMIPEEISNALEKGEINDLMIKNAIKAFSKRFD